MVSGKGTRHKPIFMRIKSVCGPLNGGCRWAGVGVRAGGGGEWRVMWDEVLHGPEVHVHR